MDFFPLINSLRVAAISTVLTFVLGIWAANGITRLPTWVKGALDCLWIHHGSRGFVGLAFSLAQKQAI